MAIIGFITDAYTVTEGINQSANLNVELISGQLGRDVIVIFSTESVSATSIILNLMNYAFEFLSDK